MTMAGSVGSAGSSSSHSTLSNAASHTTSPAQAQTQQQQAPSSTQTQAQSLAQSPTTVDRLAQAQTPGQVAASQVTAAQQLAAAPTAAERLAQAPNGLLHQAFCQAPTSAPLTSCNSVPQNGTHIGMTEEAGAANGFNSNFTGWAADSNAQVDHSEYSNDAAHAYNFSSQATLARAGTLGARVEAAATGYLAATDAAGRQNAARELATAFGQYEHMVQDNRAHGGTNRAQHYGDHVDENRQSMAAARRDTNASFAELHAYLQSRGIDPRAVDPGPRPSYNYPPLAQGFMDQQFAPQWDGVDHMWNRDAMFNAMRDRFDLATPMGPNPVSL
jgi:hypothetical protein